MDGFIILSIICMQTSRHFVEDFRKFLLVFTDNDVLVLARIDCWIGPPGHQGCWCSMFGCHILPGCPERVSAYRSTFDELAPFKSVGCQEILSVTADVAERKGTRIGVERL